MRWLCHRLQVSVSGFYDYFHRKPIENQKKRKKTAAYISMQFQRLKGMTRGNGIFTYHAKDTENIPGTLWFNFTDSFTNSYDVPAVDAHYYDGKTYDYYKSKFNRNSYDNAGASIKSSVHSGTNYNNAF